MPRRRLMKGHRPPLEHRSCKEDKHLGSKRPPLNRRSPLHVHHVFDHLRDPAAPHHIRFERPLPQCEMSDEHYLREEPPGQEQDIETTQAGREEPRV